MTRYCGPRWPAPRETDPRQAGTRTWSLPECNQTPPRQRATLRPWLYHQPVAAGLGTAQSVQ